MNRRDRSPNTSSGVTLGWTPAVGALGDDDAVEDVPTLFDAAFGNSGQWCIAVKRLYVHESLHRRLVDEHDHEGLAESTDTPTLTSRT